MDASDRLDLAQQITTNFTKRSIYFKFFIHHTYSYNVGMYNSFPSSILKWHKLRNKLQ